VNGKRKSANETAVELDLDRKTVYRMLKHGTTPSIRSSSSAALLMNDGWKLRDRPWGNGRHLKPSTTMGIYAHEIPGTGSAARVWDEVQGDSSVLRHPASRNKLDGI